MFVTLLQICFDKLARALTEQACAKLLTSLIATTSSICGQQPCYSIVRTIQLPKTSSSSCYKALQVCWNKLSQALRVQPVEKLLEQHCYKSAAGLLQVLRLLCVLKASVKTRFKITLRCFLYLINLFQQSFFSFSRQRLVLSAKAAG